MATLVDDGSDREGTCSQPEFVVLVNIVFAFINQLGAQRENRSESRKKWKSRRTYLKRRAPELALEIYCLVCSVRSACLYDHGGFATSELGSLLLKVNECFQQHASSDADNSPPLVVLKLNDSTFLLNPTAFFARYRATGDWEKTIFVNISPSLEAPEVLSEDDQHVQGILGSVADIAHRLQSLAREETLEHNVVFKLVDGKARGGGATFEVAGFMVALHGIFLEYPVVYCMKGGNNFSGNCLGNEPLVLYTIAADVNELNVGQAKLPESFSCIAFSVPETALNDRTRNRVLNFTTNAVGRISSVATATKKIFQNARGLERQVCLESIAV